MLKHLSIKNIFKVLASIAILTLALYFAFDLIQKKENIMSFEDYNPSSSLVVPENKIYKSKYPFIDVHNHQFKMGDIILSRLVKQMDSMNMAYLINLSGSGWGPQPVKDLILSNSIKNIKENFPDRFGVFVNIDFESIDDPDYALTQTNIIRNAVDEGAIGLKVYKSLGLTNKDLLGNRIAVNDPRLDPVWAVCGELKIPV